MKTIELSIPDDLHARLQRIAKEAGEPTKEVARKAISAGLALSERKTRHRAILAYARKHAGSLQDLDPELESASLESLQSSLDEHE